MPWRVVSVDCLFFRIFTNCTPAPTVTPTAFALRQPLGLLATSVFPQPGPDLDPGRLILQDRQGKPAIIARLRVGDLSLRLLQLRLA